MSFFGKKKPSAVPAGRSTLGVIGSLFNPHIGATLRPLGETGKMLVTIIAMVFAANGLFPRNHPALISSNSNVRLTLPEVIRIGWSNIVFSRKTMPQTLIFFAVVLSLGCSALMIVVGLMAVLTGTAHAQVPALGPAMFQPPPLDSNDVACGWVNWLFGTNAFGCNLQDYLQPNGQQLANLQSTVIQASLIAALGFYSDVILVVAAVVLFYHLTAMIVETAHHGVIMGRRANQVWAPIRLVVAVGLLVPIAAGLNSGQFIVIQIAQWGTAVASNAWAIFLQAVAADPTNQLVPPLAPIVREEVANIILMEACATAYNSIENNPYIPGAVNTGSQINPTPNPFNQPDGSIKFSFTPAGNGGAEHQNDDLCGYYILSAPIAGNQIDQQLGQAIRQAGIAAFTAVLPNITTFAQQSIMPFLSGSYGGNAAQALPVNNQFEGIIDSLYIALQAQLGNIQNFLAAAMQAAVIAAQQEGWVAAGAWFNTIARIQGDVTDLAHDFPYKTAPPQVFTIVKDNEQKAGSTNVKLNAVMTAYQQWLNREVNQANPVGNGLSPDQQQVQLAQLGIVGNNGAGKNHVMDMIFEAVDYIASRDGVWQPAVTNCVNPGGQTACFALGVQFTGANPLAEIAAFGHSNINTAYDVFDEYLVLMGIVTVTKDAAQAIGGLGAFQGNGRFSLASIFAKVFGATAQAGADASNAIGDVVGMIVVVFFTGGFMLAFFLPLIPFYRFMFGTLSWFLSLMEAIIAMPLVALAHLTPEGEGFMGDKAKSAYYFVFNLFLRPILMVFGLIAGYLLFCIAASLMNLLYVTAVAAAGGIGYGHYTLARIVYSIIYVVILYLSCNKCFQMIDWLPEHAIKWMGAQGLHHAPMGDPMEVGGYMGLASGYVEQKIVAGAGQVMKSPAALPILGEMQNRGMTAGAIGELSKHSTAAGNAAKSILGKTGDLENWIKGDRKEKMPDAPKGGWSKTITDPPKEK